ncbi:hypothetical protein V1498_19350 [Peribacillus sp. SCS-26]|uniref:hypothetical protein n=1 Tax=Paraperibacillus marinus TaxID=3115295 RepID=UPI003906883F
MNLIGWLIVASEIGFWIVIILGLAARYMLKMNKLGLFLLALTPIIDLFLLAAAGFDLSRGAVATKAHAIAAVYIGISIAFGKSMIEWADVRFRYYIAKEGRRPLKRTGMDYAKHYFKGWTRHVLAYLIGAGLLGGMIFIIQDPSRTEALEGILKIWTLVVGIDFLISLSYFIWPPKKEPGKTEERQTL